MSLRTIFSGLWLVQLLLGLSLWPASSAAFQAPAVASRPSHLPGHRFLRFYVADIPLEYSYVRAFHDPYRYPDAPLDRLGPMQHPESVQYSTYNSDYNRGVCQCRAGWQHLSLGITGPFVLARTHLQPPTCCQPGTRRLCVRASLLATAQRELYAAFYGKCVYAPTLARPEATRGGTRSSPS